MELLNNLLLALGITLPIAKILPIVLIINAALAGIRVTLDKLKSYAVVKDGPVFGIIGTISHYAGIILDFLSANTAHKDK